MFAILQNKKIKHRKFGWLNFTDFFSKSAQSEINSTKIYFLRERKRKKALTVFHKSWRSLQMESNGAPIQHKSTDVTFSDTIYASMLCLCRVKEHPSSVNNILRAFRNFFGVKFQAYFGKLRMLWSKFLMLKITKYLSFDLG